MDTQGLLCIIKPMNSAKNGSSSLDTQVLTFIDQLEGYSRKQKRNYSEKNYQFLRDFYLRFFNDRNKRSAEVTSSHYESIKQLAVSQYPAPTLWDLCMDGRVLAILINGASAGVGSSVRVPGGILREFVRGTDGKMKLIEHSNFAKLLDRVFARFTTDTIYEVFDSHLGCAARKAEELAHGYDAEDSGLFADIVHKKEIAQAAEQYVLEKFNKKKKIVAIQTSFDPHSGYLYMALETDNALQFAREKGNVYTTAVLEELVQKGDILSAKVLVEDEEVTTCFKEHTFDLDWKGNYVVSAEKFWKNIADMKPLLSPYITKLLINIYPYLAKTKDGKDELEERAMLLLTNAYSGYLNNLQGKDGRQYPYGVHREEGVKVSEGGYPPYEISMFVVFSLDKKNLPANIELASSLVRNNRKEGRIIDRSKTYLSVKDFVMAPVPVVVQGLVRETVSEKEWEEASRIDWSDLPKNWDMMSAPDFYGYLQTKGNMSIAIANGINRLREKMTVLYDPDNPTSAHLIEQYKVALPVIVGKNRMNHFIVPFLKLGFS